jgi:hypothetical protein
LFEFHDFFLSPIASNGRDECLQYGLDTDLRAFVGAVENPIYGFVARVPPYLVFACFPVSFAAYFGQVDYFCFRHAVTSEGGRFPKANAAINPTRIRRTTAMGVGKLRDLICRFLKDSRS